MERSFQRLDVAAIGENKNTLSFPWHHAFFLSNYLPQFLSLSAWTSQTRSSQNCNENIRDATISRGRHGKGSFCCGLFCFSNSNLTLVAFCSLAVTPEKQGSCGAESWAKRPDSLAKESILGPPNAPWDVLTIFGIVMIRRSDVLWYQVSNVDFRSFDR